MGAFDKFSFVWMRVKMGIVSILKLVVKLS